MRKILPLLALLLAACLFEKEGKDHTLVLTGKLSDLRADKNEGYFWFLNVDSLVPGYTMVWTNAVCDGEGYLGDAAATSYTNAVMTPSSVNPEYYFFAPRDTALAHGFTHYRLEISCPDSVDFPPEASQ